MSGEVAVAVRVKPGASRTRVGGEYPAPDGAFLVVAVAAPAVDGRATEAARRALAQALRVRRSAVALRSGATSRTKVFTVACDDPRKVRERVAELLQGGDPQIGLGSGRAGPGRAPS